MAAIALVVVFGVIYLTHDSPGDPTYDNFHKPFNGSGPIFAFFA